LSGRSADNRLAGPRAIPSGRTLDGSTGWLRHGGSLLISLLSRFLRRHRRALVARVEQELAGAMTESRAEAIAFLARIESSLGTGKISALQQVVEETAQRWDHLGVPRDDVHRALLSPVLPPDVFQVLHGRRDPWAEVAPQFMALLQAVPISLLLVDADRRIRVANPAAIVENSGRSPVGEALDDVVADASREWVARQMADFSNESSRFGSLRLAADPRRERLACAVPLKAGGSAFGWILALMPEPEKALADPTLANSLQHERDQKDKFAALLAVSQAMMSSLELNEILATLARQVRRVFGVDEVTVFLYDEHEQALRPAVCDVENYVDEIMQLRLKLGEGITGSVALSGRPEIVNVAEDDPRAVQVPGTPNEDRSSLLCVPLHQRGRVVGAISLVNLDGRPFSQQDLEPATLFAGLCSAAIANARLYEDTRTAYDELRETQTQLVQSANLNALGEMAGGVAHDFNNILAAILGRTQLLLQQVEAPELRSQLRVIEQAALDGAHTVRRVQEFTRVRHDADFETLDLNQVIEGVIELTRPVWEEGTRRRGIAIDLVTDLGARQTIAGNASELREVFTNLVLNAVDALPWGGELKVTSRDDEGQVLVRFRDNGIGMSAEVRQRIFDPFFTTKAVKGTGLGLSVAYGIVTRHEGAIAVESEMHLGTEFTVRFPAGRGRDVVVPPMPPGPLPRLRVLVVDDEEVVLDVLADLLRVLDQNVTTARGGIAGRDTVLAGDFDVVFSDLGMPDLNGWDLALTVKSTLPHVGVVLVTGWGTQLEGGAALAHGVDLVLSKPVSIDDLDRAIRQIGEARTNKNQRAA
jgi:signal transduction histidine kinase/CheY-like chemotaxis protein